jgi:hypothetical protein
MKDVIKPDSVWDSADELAEDEIELLVTDLIRANKRPSPDSRFITYIGTSASNPSLDLLTARVELTRFGLSFGDGSKELTKLYGDISDTICILVIDDVDKLHPKLASASRIAFEDDAHIYRLPTVQALRVGQPESRGFDQESKTWTVTQAEYEKALAEIALDQDLVYDGSTIASMPEYRNGAASLPIFSAYARAARNGYCGFRGNFASTIVKDVADIIGMVGGFKVLRKIEGTSYEEFSGAPNTAPHIGKIDPSRFSSSMADRVSTRDEEIDIDGSTYVFL